MKSKKAEPTQEELRAFVRREVMTCQSYLVEELLKKGIFDYDDIVNFYKTDEDLKDEGYRTAKEREEARDNGENQREVFEWWIVSSWLLEKLEQQGQPILKTDLGEWWGRTCTGQAIFLDGVIERIYTEARG